MPSPYLFKMIGLQTGSEFIIALLEGMEVQKLMREPVTAGGNLFI